jgi:hypothetical protein
MVSDGFVVAVVALLIVIGLIVADSVEGKGGRREEKGFFEVHYGAVAIAVAVIVIYTKEWRDQFRRSIREWWSGESEDDGDVDTSVVDTADADITPEMRRKLLGKHVDPDGYGGTTGWGTWTQTTEELEIVATLPADWKGTAKSIECKITSSTLLLTDRCKESTVLEGKLFKAIDPEGSSWQLERGSGAATVLVTLQKREPTKQSGHWPHVLLSDPKIDTQEFGTPITTIDSSRPESIKNAVRSLYSKKR